MTFMWSCFLMLLSPTYPGRYGLFARSNESRFRCTGEDNVLIEFAVNVGARA